MEINKINKENEEFKIKNEKKINEHKEQIKKLNKEKEEYKKEGKLLGSLYLRKFENT